jgi:hypothetical protein
MARLREAQEHPEWRWERERRQTIRDRVDSLRSTGSRSQVPVTPELRKQMETVASIGLPATIRFEAGRLAIACRDMEHLVEQLVLVAKSLDSDYERLQGMVEPPARKKPPSGVSGHAVATAAAAS